MKRKIVTLVSMASLAVIVVGTSVYAFDGFGGRHGDDDGVSFFEELVEDGIITEDQFEEIEEKIEEEKYEKQAEQYASLVEEGILTDDEVEDIIEYMDEIREEMMEAREELETELEDMTDEEKREYLQSIDREEMTNPFDGMVEEGIIDEDQLEAIKEVIKSNKQRQGGMGNGQRGDMEDQSQDGEQKGGLQSSQRSRKGM